MGWESEQNFKIPGQPPKVNDKLSKNLFHLK